MELSCACCTLLFLALHTECHLILFANMLACLQARGRGVREASLESAAADARSQLAAARAELAETQAQLSHLRAQSGAETHTEAAAAAAPALDAALLRGAEVRKSEPNDAASMAGRVAELEGSLVAWEAEVSALR